MTADVPCTLTRRYSSLEAGCPIEDVQQRSHVHDRVGAGHGAAERREILNVTGDVLVGGCRCARRWRRARQGSDPPPVSTERANHGRTERAGRAGDQDRPSG